MKKLLKEETINPRTRSTQYLKSDINTLTDKGLIDDISKAAENSQVVVNIISSRGNSVNLSFQDNKSETIKKFEDKLKEIGYSKETGNNRYSWTAGNFSVTKEVGPNVSLTSSGSSNAKTDYASKAREWFSGKMEEPIKTIFESQKESFNSDINRMKKLMNL
jgi:hypothetical protein